MADFDMFNSGDDYDDSGRPLEDYEAYFNVRGLLANRFGAAMGDEIYTLLRDAATAVSDQVDAPTVPGILFRPEDAGGEFVGFEMPDDDFDDEEDDEGYTYSPDLTLLADDEEDNEEDDEDDEEGF